MYKDFGNILLADYTIIVKNIPTGLITDYK
jgi:hypothetical protein